MFVSVCGNVVDVGAELEAAVFLAVAGYSLCSRRLNINRETSTVDSLVIILASLPMFLNSIVCIHVCQRGRIATRYFLGSKVRIKTHSSRLWLTDPRFTNIRHVSPQTREGVRTTNEIMLDNVARLMTLRTTLKPP